MSLALSNADNDTLQVLAALNEMWRPKSDSRSRCSEIYQLAEATGIDLVLGTAAVGGLEQTRR